MSDRPLIRTRPGAPHAREDRKWERIQVRITGFSKLTGGEQFNKSFTLNGPLTVTEVYKAIRSCFPDE